MRVAAEPVNRAREQARNRARARVERARSEIAGQHAARPLHLARRVEPGVVQDELRLQLEVAPLGVREEAAVADPVVEDGSRLV